VCMGVRLRAAEEKGWQRIWRERMETWDTHLRATGCQRDTSSERAFQPLSKRESPGLNAKNENVERTAGRVGSE
jgi:hypothetical protein